MLEFKFSTELDCLETKEGQKFCCRIRSQAIELDYGTIIKSQSPFNPSKLLVILAGVRTFGTSACGAVIAVPITLRPIVNQFSDKAFQIVTEARMVSHSPVSAGIRIASPASLQGKIIRNPFHRCGVLSKGAEMLAVGATIVEDRDRILDYLDNLGRFDIEYLRKRVRLSTILSNSNFLLSGATIISAFGLIIASLLSEYPLYSVLRLALMILAVFHLRWGRKRQ